MHLQQELNDLIRTGRRCKRIGLGFEGKSHREDVTHGFIECFIGLELRIRIDIGVHFEIHIVQFEEITKLISCVNGHGNFVEHTLLDSDLTALRDVGDEHEPPTTLAQNDDDRSVFDTLTVYLGVRTDTRFELVTSISFADDSGFDSIENIVAPSE